MKHIEVVAAIFQKDDRIFCAQRKNRGSLALKWEFPGGKIESGETHEEALIREIREELETIITVKDHCMTINHSYETFHLTMHTYYCEIMSGPLELKEHADARWVKIEDLLTLDWAEADYPIVERLIKVDKLREE